MKVQTIKVEKRGWRLIGRLRIKYNVYPRQKKNFLPRLTGILKKLKLTTHFAFLGESCRDKESNPNKDDIHLYDLFK